MPIFENIVNIPILIKRRDISNFCRDHNIVGCSRGFRKRILEAEEIVTPDKCRKYFNNMQRYFSLTIFMKFILVQPLLYGTNFQSFN